jgi:tetratricopeptide (TPR) repeat protein
MLSFRLFLLGCFALGSAAVLRADVPPALAPPAAAPATRPEVARPVGPPVAPPPAAIPPSAIPPSAATAPAESTDTAPLPADAIARATARLKELVARQDSLLAALNREGSDLDNVKRDIQTLLFDYDDFLQKYPTFSPGYVTYGLLLGKVGMRRESSMILLKANQLDPNLPIVKNQLGNYLAEEGEPVEAVNYFIAAARLAPDEPLYHFQLGRLIAAARDDFIKSGQWTGGQLDDTMLAAFKRAAELAPENIMYAYSYAESFYDLAEPKWDEALKLWGALEDRVSPGLEKETIRLQAANVLIKQKRFDHARLLLNTVTAIQLVKQKQKLLDELAANADK